MKLKLILFLAFLSLGCLKSVGNDIVCLYGDNRNGKPDYSEIPIVTYDEEQVTITADTLLYNVRVVIKDEAGAVMYSGMMNVSSAETTLPVPDGLAGRKYSIELYYEDNSLYGRFL